MTLVVERYDRRVRDEWPRAIVLDPAGVSRKDETVLPGRPGVFEARVIDRAAELAGRDDASVEEDPIRIRTLRLDRLRHGWTLTGRATGSNVKAQVLPSAFCFAFCLLP